MLRLAKIIVLTTGLAASMGAASGPSKPRAPLEVDGCRLLKQPAKFNNRLVEVTGRAYGAFESWSLNFDCPGYLNLTQSLDEPDIRKYGFRTVQDSEMRKFSHILFPNPDLMAREAHYSHVTLVGRFRCHYDFSDCKNISIHGDSSIVIRSIIASSNRDESSPAGVSAKE